ncbi:piggyBac transposable element-derived protein 2-like protein [Lates japonicus]|uniref:PiggyBac transposable element-derived protein 2-like protein n=1 Tax=Lates japonicus TaxID=270547 RepID=A0AAD3NLV3_LATJO|nr:piggyBac transposable element-derived protein 2-like protein [Lates japonicus]
MGVEPMSSVIRYCSETKMKEPVSCPAVIRSFNANMGGIDKSDMLVHLYCTPMKSKRCKALGVNGQSLKDFRIQVFRGASGQTSAKSSSRRRLSSSVESLTTSVDVPEPVRGHRSHTPNEAVRFDLSLFHAPVHAKHQTCKYCSRKGKIVRSNVVCRVCKAKVWSRQWPDDSRTNSGLSIAFGTDGACLADDHRPGTTSSDLSRRPLRLPLLRRTTRHLCPDIDDGQAGKYHLFRLRGVRLVCRHVASCPRDDVRF